MNQCRRCGIDVQHAGFCRDCSEVEQIPYREGIKQQRYVVHGRRKFVTSSFGIGQRLSPAVHAEIRARTRRGESTRVIALAVGCSSQAVTRERRAMKNEREEQK